MPSRDPVLPSPLPCLPFLPNTRPEAQRREGLGKGRFGREKVEQGGDTELRLLGVAPGCRCPCFQGQGQVGVAQPALGHPE